MLWSAPLLNLKVSVASSDESNTTGRSKSKLPPLLLFCIGWVTPEPVIVKTELFVAVIVTEAADESLLFLICATVLLLSTIRSASTVTLALSTFGIPADQFAAFDHKLSPPALVKVDTDMTIAEIWPDVFITAASPAIVIWATWSAVSPLASVPKDTSLFPAPVILSVPVPQSADELSANAAEVTSASSVKFKFPLPIVIVPRADWFLLRVRVKAWFFVLILPLKTFAPLTIILWPVELSPVSINTPVLRKIELSAESTVKVVSFPFIKIPPLTFVPL